MKAHWYWGGYVVLLAGIFGTVYAGIRPISGAQVCANPGNCNALPVLEVDNKIPGIYNNAVIQPPDIRLGAETNPEPVLGETAAIGSEKRIFVNLKNQVMQAYDGKTLFMETKVSTGKWGRTPPGEYTIWTKLRATRMRGGTGDDAYDLPNVPYVLFFYNAAVPKMAGFSFHGAYWHNNFGHPMSHGCVNMREIDAKKLYDWATPVTTGPITYATEQDTGTKVTIY